MSIPFLNPILVNQINEYTINSGVTIEGVLIKDSTILLPVTTGMLIFGDGDTYIYEVTDDTLRFRTSGADRFLLTTTMFAGVSANGGGIMNEAGSTTNPTIIPNRADANAGLGSATTNEFSFISNSVEIARITASGFLVDYILEKTTNAGVNIDSSLIKDAKIYPYYNYTAYVTADSQNDLILYADATMVVELTGAVCTAYVSWVPSGTVNLGSSAAYWTGQYTRSLYMLASAGTNASYVGPDNSDNLTINTGTGATWLYKAATANSLRIYNRVTADTYYSTFSGDSWVLTDAGTVKVTINKDGILLPEITAPSAPASNNGIIYCADAAGITKLYFKTSTNTYELSAAGDVFWGATGANPLIYGSSSSGQINSSTSLIYDSSTRTIYFQGYDGIIEGGYMTAAVGEDLTVRGGTGGATNYNGGALYLTGGVPNGTGLYGNIYIGCSGAGVSYSNEIFIQPSATGSGYTSLLGVDANRELYSITFSNHSVVDYVVTTDTSGGLNGEANLTFNGSLLTITGNLYLATGADRTIKVADGTTTAYDLTVKAGYTTSAANAGDLYLYGGENASGNGGYAYLVGGTASGSGGHAYIVGGTGTGTGGDAYVRGGGSGTGGGGNVYIRGGDGSAADGIVYIGDQTTASIYLGSAAIGSATAEAGEYLFLDATDSYLKKATNSLVSVTPTPLDNQIAVWTSGINLEGTSSFTWNGTVLGITGNILFGSSSAEIYGYTTGTGGNVTIRGGTGSALAGGNVTINGGTGNTTDGYINLGTSSTTAIYSSSTALGTNVDALDGEVLIFDATDSKIKRANNVIIGSGTSNYISVFDATNSITGTSALSFTAAGGLIAMVSGTTLATFDSSSTTYDQLILDGGGAACDTMITFKDNGTASYSIGSDAGEANDMLVIRGGEGVLSTNRVLYLQGSGVAGSTSTLTLYQADNTTEGSNCQFVASVNGGSSIAMLTYTDAQTGTYITGVNKAGASIIYAGSLSNALLIGISGNYPLYISTNATVRMNIDGSGYVGIGTDASSSYKLYSYINEATKYAGYFYNANSTGYGLYVKVNNSGAYPILKCESSAAVVLSVEGWGVALIGDLFIEDTYNILFDSSTGPTIYSDSGSLHIDCSPAAGHDLYLDINSTHGLFITGLDSGSFTGYLRYDSASTYGVCYSSSDARLKTNIRDWEVDALSTLKSFVPKQFTWRKDNKEARGWIAQEGVNYIPEMFPFVARTQLYALAEFEILPYFHKGILQLNNKIETQEEKIAKLETKINNMKKELDLLKRNI